MSGLVRLDGVVLDAEQRPAGSAHVRLEPGHHVKVAQSNGTFAFEQLPPRRFWVSARHENSCAAPTLIRLLDSDQHLTLRLNPGRTLIIRVFAGGNPAVGAKLIIPKEQIEARTDDNGTVVVRGLTPHAYEGWLILDGWAAEYVQIDLHMAVLVERCIQLQPGASIQGVVLGPGLSPICDATIRLRNMIGDHWVDAARTTADGRWQLNVAQGWFRITAASADHGPVADVDIQCDGRTPDRSVVIQLHPRRRVSGTVVDDRGQPVPYAWVGAAGAGGVTHDTSTDGNGVFTLSGLNASAHRLYASTWSKASAAVRLPALRSGTLWRLVRRIRRTQCVIEVEEARIAGQVVDDSGQPVAEAKLEIAHLGRSSRLSLATLTSVDGRFDLGAFEPGHYSIQITPKDSLFSCQRDVCTNTTNLRLLIVSGAVIRGRVLVNGAAVVGFAVSLSQNKNGKFGRKLVMDSEGRFLLRNVDPGQWRLRLVAPRTGHKVFEIEVSQNQELDLGDIALDLGECIAGYVRDPSGSLVAGAQVIIGYGSALHEQSQLDQWFDGCYDTRTDEKGAYRFDGVESRREILGPRMIWAVHPALGVSVIKDLPEKRASIDFELLGFGCIQGKVEGLCRGRVSARRDGEPEGARVQVLREMGDFRFDAVPVGDYEVSLDTSLNTQPPTTRVTVDAGQTAIARLRVQKSGIRLTISVPKGRGADLVLASAKLDTPEPHEEKIRIVVLDESTKWGVDRVSFDNVVPGTYRASIDGQTWRLLTVTSSPSEQCVDIS